ncbi:unnamed protein product, partial [marine sediment metagenome]
TILTTSPGLLNRKPGSNSHISFTSSFIHISAAPFPSPATSKKDDYIDAVKSNLEICNDLDIPKLRVDTADPPTGIPGGMDYETCFSKIAEVWNSAADICMKDDVKLIWEFEPGFLFNKPGEVVRMV